MKSNVENLAKSKGYKNLRRLAKDAGVTPEALYKWRRVGIEKAQLGSLVKVANALGCTVDDLYTI